jgi:hypothetical protein
VDVFLSGLGGALVGSLIGFLGSWWIQHRALNHDEKGAARALFFEMVANAAVLRRVVYNRETGSRSENLASSTWESTQSRVASLLTPNELLLVAQAYEDLPHWQSFIDEHEHDGRSENGEWDTFGREWDMLTEVADSIVEAAEILRDRGWAKRDLDNFPAFRGGARAIETVDPPRE